MRTVVIGNSGAGKSTFARQLAETTSVARLELDAIVWEPHQIAVARPIDAVHADLNAFLARHDGWVIEGCDGDLAEIAVRRCTELVFLNPGIASCVERNRRRPWEPHKYDSPEAQEKMLPFLLTWVEEYETRQDGRSYSCHRRVFDAFKGMKREVG